MLDVHILAVGTALPGPAVDNATLMRKFRVSSSWEQWVATFIGTRTRHLAVNLSTGEQDYSLSDLCESAARGALTASGLPSDMIDLIVMGTASPELLMPTTASVVADRLGIDGVPVYQLQSGCTGAFQALDTARQLLLTGSYRTALVLGGDVGAKLFDYDIDMTKLPPDQMVNYVLFGDAAGALVLSTADAPGSALIRASFTRLTGLNRQPGQVVDWFGPADRHSQRAPMREDYKAIEESVPLMSEEILAELLDDLGWKISEIDYLLPPQLSGRMTDLITGRLAVPCATEVSCVRETGNTGNATPFFQLARALPQMSPGDRAIGISVESSKWIKAGFALEKG